MAIVEPTVRRKIECMYRAQAELIRTTHIAGADARADREIWMFALRGHPTAEFCFAEETDGRVRIQLDDFARPFAPA